MKMKGDLVKKRWFLWLILLLIFVSCTRKEEEKPKIIVGASPFPHAKILYAAQPYLEEKGYLLEVKEYSDYIKPNFDLEDRKLNANYFQHQPYLDNFNETNGTHLISATPIHYEALGIYAGKMKSIEEIKTKSSYRKVTIAIPSDLTNTSRALLLLEAQGIIQLKENSGLHATLEDIISNPYNVEIVCIEAEKLPEVLTEYDFAIINGNYALQEELDMEKALATEDAGSLAARTYANVLAVYEGDEETEAIKALVEVLKSPEISAYINTLHTGMILSMN